MLVRRVVWPIQVRDAARDPRGCADLSPADLIVEEDGQPVRVTAVERRPTSMLHGLVLDVSSSMRPAGRLELAQAAALDYVGRLPPDEPMMLVTFDSEMRLGAPPTLDRAALRAAIGEVAVGDRTAFWDTASQVLRYVDTLPGFAVVVLLSDGTDNASLLVPAARRLRETAAVRPSVAVFSIGVDLPHSDAVQNALRDLAIATGGKYYNVRGGEGLLRIFRDVREHVEGRRYVSYVPPPFGRGPRDDAAAGERWRVVSVRPSEHVKCRIESDGPPARLEVAAPDVEGLPPAVGYPFDPQVGLSVLRSCGVGKEPPRAAFARRFPSPAGWPGTHEPGRLVAADGLGWLAGRTADVVRDRDVLVGHVATRPFAVRVPALEEARDRASAAAVLEVLLSPNCIEPGPDAPHHPLLVHGKTLFELREAVAQAIFDLDPAYRRWAIGRHVATMRPEISRVVEGLRRSGAHETGSLERMERAMLEAATSPPPPTLQRYLAEWLGDTPVFDAAIAFERSRIDRLLASGEAKDATAVGEAWQRLSRWLGADSPARVYTALVLGYDPARDVFGFHRLIPPRGGAEGWTSRPLPPAPLGFDLVRRLPGRFAPGARTAALDYGPLRRPDRARITALLETPPGGGWTTVQVVVADDSGAGSDLVLVGYYPPGAPDPAAFSLCSLDGTPPGFDEASSDLAPALRLPCRRGAAFGVPREPEREGIPVDRYLPRPYTHLHEDDAEFR